MKQRLAQRHLERGRQFELQGRQEEALEAYRQACALDNALSESFFMLGQLEANRGQMDAALQALEQAVACERHPDYVEWRAYLYGRLRRHQDALDDYRSLFELGEPLVRVNAGRMLLALRRFEEAEQVLEESAHPTAQPLLEAVPRYREFGREEPADDMRAIRYLFGATLLLGTLGDGGHPLSVPQYLLLTPDHVALTLTRLAGIIRRRGWRFAGVAGSGPKHAPVAAALAVLLGLNVLDAPPGQGRVLLASGVIDNLAEARSLQASWRTPSGGALHVACGMLPVEPSGEEPHLLGVSCRSACWWHRVHPFARLEPGDGEPGSDDAAWPGFVVGPPHIDPNVARVSRAILDACDRVQDHAAGVVFEYFDRHAQTRAFALGDRR